MEEGTRNHDRENAQRLCSVNVPNRLMQRETNDDQ